MRILSMLTLFLFACGDKDTDKPIDTADTSDSTVDSLDSSDTVDSVDTVDTTDSEFETTCLQPEFTNERAFFWKDPQQYGGFTATVSSTHALIANTTPGYFYGVSWGADEGYIEDVADFTITGFAYGFDKAMYSEGWVGIADAYAYNVGGLSTGALYLYSDDYISTLTGTLTVEESAQIIIYGEEFDGWTGAFVLWDVTNDGRLDAVVSTGPYPGNIAVFSEFESYVTEVETTGLTKRVNWNEANFILSNLCTVDSFAPNNLKIFAKGSGDGYLAAGCPAKDYLNGEVLIYDLPLEEDSTPDYHVTGVSGWRMDSNGYKESLYLESKGADRLVVVYQNGPRTLDYDIIDSSVTDPMWWGSSPTLTQFTNDNEEVCTYLVTSDQQYRVKGVETGAVFGTLIGPDHLATEWIDMSIPSSEIDQLLYIGAVNEFSPDGRNLMSTGWERVLCCWRYGTY